MTPGPRRRPAAGPAILALAASLLAAPASRSASAAVRPPADLAAADRLAAEPPSRARDSALGRWGRRASLEELVYLLRRPPAELGAAEPPLVRAALDRVPASRVALRARLAARHALIESRRARPVGGGPVLYPRASVFRVAALLPDSGDYRGYAGSVRAGLSSGLADPAARFGIEVEARATGTDRPAQALAAFEAVAPRAGAAVGELLSVPTLVLATAARYAGVPLISPTATDEEVGAIGGTVFQVGPSGWQRGAALAEAALDGRRPRIGVLVSSAAAGAPLARGFAARAESAGAAIAWREEYPAGSLGFREAARAIAGRGIELLFWDGDPREAEALVRQLTRERISLRLCGGSGLAPEQHHAETRVLLEGVQYVGDEWQAAPALAERAREGAGEEGTARLWLQGYLAGRVLREAVEAGALCPEELVARLVERSRGPRYLAERGFLDVASLGATIPVYTVRRGRAVPR